LSKNGFSVTCNADDARDYVRDHMFGLKCK